MDQIIAKYRDTGIRLTPQRIAILKYLDGNTSHPTAEDIFRDVRKNYPTLSFATVYNTLQTLKHHGDVIEITIDPLRKHYDPNTKQHHHVVCIRCNKIWDVFEDYSESLKLPASFSGEIRIVGSHVDFYGLCKSCHNGERG